MRLLDRYILSSFIKNVGLGVFGMTLMFLFQAMFTDIFEHRFETTQIVIYHLLDIPKIVVQMAGPSILLATMLTLMGFAKTQELIAFLACGMSIWRLVSILAIAVCALSAVLYGVQDKILPVVYRYRTNYYWREMEKKTDFYLDVKRDKIWYRSKNMIYNLERFDQGLKTIYGISIYTFDEHFHLTQFIGAETAEYSSDGWILHHGTISVFTAEDSFPLTQKFETKRVIIAETPKEFQEIEKEGDSLNFHALDRYIRRMKRAGADTKAFEVKYQSRFALLAVPLVMFILALPFSIQVTSRREGGMAKQMGLCLLITFCYWLFFSTGLSFGIKGALTPWVAAWLPNMIFVGFAAAWMLKKWYL